MIFKKNIVSLVILAVSLQGCSGMNSSFSCNAVAKGACMPVEDVNAAVDKGFFDDINIKKQSKAVLDTQKTKSKKMSLDKSTPVRVIGEVQKIWFAPYQDTSNNYHDESNIYVILRKPKWSRFAI